MEKVALADPALLLDEQAMHHRDLSRRPAEAVGSHLSPNAERIPERDRRSSGDSFQVGIGHATIAHASASPVTLQVCGDSYNGRRFTMRISDHRFSALILPFAFSLAVTGSALGSAQPTSQREASGSLDTALIERLTGAKGALDAAEGVFKVSVPRTDLGLEVAGVRMVPRLGITSWAAFKRAQGGAIVMGDLVLRAEQVNPVMSVALDNG